MSKGPGHFQERLLRELEHGCRFRNELMWSLAEDMGQIIVTGTIAPKVQCGRISSNFEKQFGHAIRSLHDRKRIVIATRSAQNTQEIVETHPFQTSSLEVRDLRKLLLPLLPNVTPRFGTSANELHLLNVIRNKDRDRHLLISDRWRRIELDLRVLLGRHPSADNIAFMLVRGRELFHRTKIFATRVTCSEGFLSLWDRARQDDAFGSAEELRSRIDELCDDVLSKDELQRLSNKSRIFEYGAFGGSGSSSIDESTKEHLLAAEPIVAMLPGHLAGSQDPFGFAEKPTFSSLLDRLIERTAFRRLSFLALP